MSEATMGRAGGAQRPVLRVNGPKKTGARSARARTKLTSTEISAMHVQCTYVADNFHAQYFQHKLTGLLYIVQYNTCLLAQCPVMSLSIRILNLNTFVLNFCKLALQKVSLYQNMYA
jgi:hypothetical protein